MAPKGEEGHLKSQKGRESDTQMNETTERGNKTLTQLRYKSVTVHSVQELYHDVRHLHEKCLLPDFPRFSPP